MDILSYRGPGSPGGVSGSLSRSLEWQAHGAHWWHQSGNALFVRHKQSRPLHVCSITRQVVDGHYQYCNNFLWPIMHDLSEFASFSSTERASYQQFNLAFALNVLDREEFGAFNSYFVQDYQLALVPGILGVSRSRTTSLFWHIPWPKSVKEQFVPFLVEIASGLLAATKVGFHTSEYALNFLKFVDTYLPEYAVDYDSLTVLPVTASLTPRTTCEVIVQPLGLDLEFWKQQANQSLVAHQHELMQQLHSVQYVLSIDRADYTKGVLQRLHAINEFFDMYPSWRQQITFVQLCQPTRVGLGAFDDYWNECVAKVTEVNSRWEHESWKPIIWVDKPAPPAVLAGLYKHARAMLVSPLRDGLNLTAKEFVACADENAGVLLMSRDIGAWQELGEQAVPVGPLQPRLMASEIEAGLSISQSERRRRILEMKKTLQVNSLSAWWQRFGGRLPERPQTIVTNRFNHRPTKLRSMS